MLESVQVVHKLKPDDGTITFFVAFGANRQMCRLATTFDTQKQAFGYLRTEASNGVRAHGAGAPCVGGTRNRDCRAFDALARSSKLARVVQTMLN
jgi:hypothetical protein